VGDIVFAVDGVEVNTITDAQHGALCLRCLNGRSRG
jgi:hypothetical protein